MHWNSWKGWLYLAIFVFISGRLFVSQGFSLTLTSTLEKTLDSTLGDNINNIAPPKNHGDRGLKMAVSASTWSSSPFGHGPKSQEDLHGSGNQLLRIDNQTRPLVATITEDDDNNSRNWNSVSWSNNNKKKSRDKNNETNQQRKEQVKNDQDTNSRSSLKEKERRYWLRSERIKRVCRNWGVVSNPLVFATSKNETRPVHSPISDHLPSKRFHFKNSFLLASAHVILKNHVRQ
jgi:hypothetical protein